MLVAALSTCLYVLSNLHFQVERHLRLVHALCMACQLLLSVAQDWHEGLSQTSGL